MASYIVKSLEHETLIACTEKLVNGLVARGPGAVSDTLVSAGLISTEVYQDMILDTNAAYKGRKLTQAVTNSVKCDSAKFYKFLEALKDNSEDHLVRILETEFATISAKEDRIVKPKYKFHGTEGKRLLSDSAVSLEGVTESSSDELKQSIEDLEFQFSDLAGRFLSYLRCNNIQVEQLTGFISVIPRSVSIYVYPMWLEICNETKTNETLNSLFTILNMKVWNILDYNLLEYCIAKFGDNDLNKRMNHYISELNKFKEETLVVKFIECWEGHNREIPNYGEVVITFDIPTVTLADLDIFRKKLAKNCFPSLVNCAEWIYYNKFQPGSFVISWILPNQLAKLLLENIKDIYMLLEEYQVRQVVLRGTAIYTSQKPCHGAKASPSDGRPIIIVVAGQKTQGRSTALNHIFGVDFRVSDAPPITTPYIAVREARIDQQSYIIVDTPDFGRGADEDIVEEEVANAIRGLNFTLLYCVSINLGNILSESDKSNLIKFQNCTHDRIWENCVLLLTNSDGAVWNFNRWHSPEEASRHFKANVKEHVLGFEAILKQISSSRIEVHTVFESMQTNVGFPGIVAVPVQSQLDVTGEDGNFVRDPDVIPGIPATYSWRDVAWWEIVKKTESRQCIPLAKKNFKIRTHVAAGIAVGSAGVGAGVGAGAGAAVGAVAGIVGGPIGIAIGAGVGTAIGAIVGVVTGVSTGVAASSYMRWLRVNPDDKIRSLRARVPH